MGINRPRPLLCSLKKRLRPSLLELCSSMEKRGKPRAARLWRTFLLLVLSPTIIRVTGYSRQRAAAVVIRWSVATINRLKTIAPSPTTATPHFEFPGSTASTVYEIGIHSLGSKKYLTLNASTRYISVAAIRRTLNWPVLRSLI